MRVKKNFFLHSIAYCIVVEWYCNGKPVQHGHRFKTTYDFGFVALDILYAHAEDTGTYMCKAKNAVGEAVTTCNVSASGKYFIRF